MDPSLKMSSPTINWLRRTVLISFMLFSFTSAAFNQLPPIVWDNIPRSDLELNPDEQKNAFDAIILCDYGTATYEDVKGDYRLVYFRHTRVKVFRQEGTRWANVSISYNKGAGDEITFLKAHAYTLMPDGKISITETRQDEFYEKASGDGDVTVTFTIPGVFTGSVFEYSYRIVSPDLLNMRSWKFQRVLPVLWSEYRVQLSGIYNHIAVLHNLTDSLRMNQKINGFSDIEAGIIGYTQRNDLIRIPITTGRYVMTNIPAIAEEPMMGPLADYIPEIRFQLYSVTFPGKDPARFIQTWDDVASYFLQNEQFGAFLSEGRLLNETMKKAGKLPDKPADKVEAIYQYVVTHFRWDHQYALLPNKKLPSLLNERSGNSAAINLLLTGLMKQAGLRAYPVLISNRSNGKISDKIPLVQQFNNLICLVELSSGSFFLSALDPDRPSDLPDPDVLNEKGLVLRPGRAEWIDLPPPPTAVRNMVISLRFQTEGTMFGFIIIREKGEFALARKKEILLTDAGTFSRNLAGNLFYGLQVDSFSYKELTPQRNESSLTVSFSSKEWINQFTDKRIIYFEALLKNLLFWIKLPPVERKFPFKLPFPVEETIVSIIEIPEGYEIESLPDEENISLPDNKASFQLKVSGNEEVAQVKSVLSLQSITFSPSEYHYLRQFMNMASAAQSQQIVAVVEDKN